MQNKLLTTLLATTFLSTNAVAQIIPEVDVDYLNNLTSPKIFGKRKWIYSRR